MHSFFLNNDITDCFKDRIGHKENDDEAKPAKPNSNTG